MTMVSQFGLHNMTVCVDALHFTALPHWVMSITLTRSKNNYLYGTYNTPARMHKCRIDNQYLQKPVINNVTF